MNALVFGAKGYIGSSLISAQPTWQSSSVDITDANQVARELDARRPSVVVNCAGKTGRPNIDWCESHRAETALANVAGPLVLMQQCLARDIYLVHMGSGCIYRGDNGGLGFGEDDPSNYFGSYYSLTKYAADQALVEHPVLILRIRMPFDGSNHPRNLINRLKGYRRVLDARNSLTYLPDFVRAAGSLIERRATGIYHIVNPGTISPLDVMHRYRDLVDSSHQFECLPPELLGEVATTGRSNCMLSGDKLAHAGIPLRHVSEAVDEALRAVSQLNKQPATVPMIATRSRRSPARRKAG